MCKCVKTSVFISTVFEVDGVGCLQRVCEQLQHCNGSGQEDVCLQTWLLGFPQGLREAHKSSQTNCYIKAARVKNVISCLGIL